MIDFLIDFLSEVGGFLLDLWTEKICRRPRKKKEEDGEEPDQQA